MARADTDRERTNGKERNGFIIRLRSLAEGLFLQPLLARRNILLRQTDAKTLKPDIARDKIKDNTENRAQNEHIPHPVPQRRGTLEAVLGIVFNFIAGNI